VFTPIQIHAPEGCLINAAYPAAVAAGNVETSTRIVDVVMGALSQAIPDKMPAMSYGTMNNLAMGYQGDQQQAPWDYYETIGGGMGAGPDTHGVSCIQAHMTNTLNTPIEVIEAHYPVLVTSYGVHRGSGGEGATQGGNGIIREYAFNHDAMVTLLTERRRHPPQGSNGGGNAKSGQNRLNGELLADKCEVAVKKGDCLTIKTPGGGGYGESR
jgi:N-methylhydantoinase B